MLHSRAFCCLLEGAHVFLVALTNKFSREYEHIKAQCFPVASTNSSRFIQLCVLGREMGDRKRRNKRACAISSSFFVLTDKILSTSRRVLDQRLVPTYFYIIIMLAPIGWPSAQTYQLPIMPSLIIGYKICTGLQTLSESGTCFDDTKAGRGGERERQYPERFMTEK